MTNRILEFIDSWVVLLDPDRLTVFGKLIGIGHLELRPLMYGRRHRVWVIARPGPYLIIGGLADWKD